MEVNKIYQMDCLDGMKELEDESIDLILTDPPFNIGKNYSTYSDNRNDYYKWSYSWIDECCRVLKKTGNLYIMNLPRHIAFYHVHLIKAGMLYKNWITWIRNDNQFYSKDRGFKPNHQDIIRFVKSEDAYFNWKGASRKPIWDKDKRVTELAGDFDTWSDITYVKGNMKEKVDHPCPWPIKLVRKIIKTSSKEGSLVLDPFMGSGTSALVCKQLNRKYIGFEIDKNYLNISNKRLSQGTLNNFNLPNPVYTQGGKE